MTNNCLSVDMSIEKKKMQGDVLNDLYTDQLANVAAEVVKERADDLRRESQIPSERKGQTSVSKVVADVVEPLKRNRNAPVVGQALKATVRSRYRCPSTGSCHDVCKYGHRVEPKKEVKKPLLGTIRESRPLIRTASGDKLVKSVVETEAKDKAMTRRLSHPELVSEKNRPPQNEGVKSAEVVALSPPQVKIKRVQKEVKPPAILTSSISRSKIDVPAAKKGVQVKTSRKAREMKMKEARSSNESGNGKAKETASNSPRTLLKKSSSIKATLLKNFRSFSRSRRLSISEDARLDEPRDVPDKAVHVIEPEEESHVNTAKNSEGNIKGIRFGLPSFSSSSAAQQQASPTQGENKLKPETVDTKHKRSGTSHQEGNSGSVWKVKFRRGTVVNLQAGSNSPKKLRFRRGRILALDQNGKAEARKSLKKIDDMGNESSDTKPEHEKVLLRRQEAAVKKDSIDLNNVIKETASKLVKTKKSRVKALVGAFESVMSFRDRKHLVETRAS